MFLTNLPWYPPSFICGKIIGCVCCVCTLAFLTTGGCVHTVLYCVQFTGLPRGRCHSIRFKCFSVLVIHYSLHIFVKIIDIPSWGRTLFYIFKVFYVFFTVRLCSGWSVLFLLTTRFFVSSWYTIWDYFLLGFGGKGWKIKTQWCRWKSLLNK